MSRREFWRLVVIRSFGNFLVLFALYGVVATFGPALYYEFRYQVIEAKGVVFKVSPDNKGIQSPQDRKNIISGLAHGTRDTSQEPGLPQILSGPKEQIIIPKDLTFSITIPKIGASAKVFPNVDPDKPDEYLPVLKQGIAHAKGSVFPGMRGNIYLFAHSTDNWWDVGRYNAVFYLLKDLSPGDEIVVFFESFRYDYVVTRLVYADPTDVSFLTREHAGEEQLVLQTCWPPGTTWKRLYVLAKHKTP